MRKLEVDIAVTSFRGSSLLVALQIATSFQSESKGRDFHAVLLLPASVVPVSLNE